MESHHKDLQPSFLKVLGLKHSKRKTSNLQKNKSLKNNLNWLNAQSKEIKNKIKKYEEIPMSVGAFIRGYISPTSWQVCNEACHSVTLHCGF